MATITVTTTKGRGVPIDESEIRSLTGDIYLDGDPGYAEATAIWNATVETRPAAVVEPNDANGVAGALAFARRKGLRVGVLSGGHNVAGTALVDGGLTVSLRKMRDIEVDAPAKRARVGGGVTLGELDAATQAHGLATPSGFVSKTGIAGLSLRGGLGHLMRRFGLSCDNTEEVEMVTGDGELRTVNQSIDPQLLWAIRGGGVDLGIVTSFVFRLHDLGPMVTLVMPVYAAENGPETIRFLRDFMDDAPRELGLIGFYGYLPDHDELPERVRNREVYVLYGCYCGPEEQAHEVTGPLRSLDGILADLSEPMPYTDVQQVLDEDYPNGMRYYWRSLYLDELNDEVISLIDDYGRNRPSAESTLDVWTLGGAIDDVEPSATAFRQRGAKYMLAVEANWEDAETDETAISLAREITRELGRFTTRSAYLNFSGSKSEGVEQLSATYGTNLERLREIKEAYDPDDVFG